MNHKVKTNWQDGMAFESEFESGHKITLDAKEAVGGKNLGPRPKPLLLSALAGCTGMDVVSLLKKMRVDYHQFSIETDANLTDEHPMHYDRIHIKYILDAKEEDRAKVEKAVNLSKDKYCGVNFMLSGRAEITTEIILTS